MGSKHMKRWMLNIIGHEENANQNHNEIPLIPIRIKLKIKCKRTSLGEDVEKLEPLYSAGGNVKW